jgi:hypothetical protein
MCACARTREYCLTRGCKKDSAEWRYTTEGRRKDHLRRVVERTSKGTRTVSRWIRPERAIAEAWLMNMEPRRGVVTIEKLGEFRVDTAGVA